MKPSRVVALTAAALLIPLLAACGGSPSSSLSDSVAPRATIGAQPSGGDPLVGTSWVLTGGLSTDVAASGIILHFADVDVSGNSGVNTYFGGYTSTTDGALAFDPLASTMMAGDEAAMALETEYLGALQSTFGYTIADGMLTVFGAADQVLTYAKK